MKIAYFTHYFPPSGFAASVNTYEIVKRLVARGHKVFVFGQPTFRTRIIPSSFHYIRSLPMNLEVYQSLPTPLPLSVIVPHTFNLFKAMKHEYDLVITQFHAFHLASLPGYIIKVLRKKPWIVKVQDLPLDSSFPTPVLEKMFTQLYYGAFLNVFGKKADKILVLTSRLKRFLEEKGYASNRIAVVPHGVDVHLFSPAISEKTHESRRTILYIGSMRRQYGLDRLIKAFALLKPPPDLRLILIGDGSERPRLIELVKKLKLEKKVDFHLYIPHDSLPEVIRDAYITVGPLCPSLANYYTIPTKVLEYFACGKTVVSSEVSNDVLIDGHTGLVIKSPTPENIAERFSNLIEDEKLTRRLGKNARRLVVERFDWERILDKLEKELQDVVSYDHP